MLVPPAAIAEMSPMEVTAATATMIIIIITQPMLTFPKNACKVLPACFSLKKRKYLTFYLLVLTLINLLL